MDNQVLAQKIFDSLKRATNSWRSKTTPFLFVPTSTGWKWICVDGCLSNKTASLQTEGFKTRIAAVRYLDAILDLHIEQGGFWRAGKGVYDCKQYDLLVCLQNNHWIIQKQNYPDIIADKNHQPFATRKAAIKYVVEHYPGYLTKPTYPRILVY